MADEANTEPTLETILKEMRAGFSAVDRRLSTIETQLENMDIRLDRLEGFAPQTRSEVMNLRADLIELKAVLK